MIKGLSVVIPTLGDEKNIERLLKSIQKQKIDLPIEVIVVFNGLNIHAFENISIKLKAVFQSINLKLLSIEEKGVNLARNKGLMSATQEVVFFSDDDCELHLTDTFSFHIKAHEKELNVFAFGGGYLLEETAGKYDRFYNYLQMKWFYSGHGKNLDVVNHLLGGNFSLKSSIAKKHNLLFDPNIRYGGSESELFVRAVRSGLILKTIDIDVIHYTKESLKTLTAKLFKQGKGKRIIDMRYGSDSEISSDQAVDRDKEILGIHRLIFNYSFWCGYYSIDNSYFKFAKHILRDFFGYLNYKRFEILKKLSR